MSLILNPQNYDICFTVASLAVLLVTLIIYMSEEYYYGRQNAIFGVLIADGIVMNLLGLLKNIWLESESFRQSILPEAGHYVQIFEKVCIYLMAYYSMRYVMTIFHIEAPNVWRKALVLVPTVYSVFVILSGLINDFFYYFDDTEKLQYRYPQAATINIGVWLYFIFAAYLILKYMKTLSSEKTLALIIYYFLMLAGIPIRILTRSSSIFEFSVSISLLLCVYTFQNPSEFIDRTSGAGTRKALDFSIFTFLLQKKKFTVLGIYIEKLTVIVGGEQVEAASNLLEQITDYLRQMCSKGNVFYTDDGYFSILIPDITPDDPVIEKTAEQIRKRFKEPWILKNNEIKLFQSPCAFGFPDEVNSIERFNEIRGVMKKALLRQNREILRISDLNLKYVEHDKKIDNIVKHALEDGLLEVYYQPIFSPELGKYNSCEALVRLKDPQLGFISPAVFMPIAERNGSVLAIDRFVLSSVCEMIASSDIKSLGIDYIEVNLSIVDCIQANMADNILEIMKKYNVSSEQINFELTETWEKDITSFVDENIGKLMKAGISFSMDDFGTGYSNIARVATMPVKIFKLDKSIIQSAFESETAYMVMLNMIKIIKSLGKEIVAEGVETAEQAKQIIRLGCDHIQGFFYSRPMPKDRFIEFITENNR